MHSRLTNGNASATKFLELLASVLRLAVNVNIRAELIGKVFLSGTARQRDRFEARLFGELDGQVTEATNTLYDDHITRASAGVSETWRWETN